MKTYRVTVKEVWRSDIFIKADSKEDAIAKVKDGDGDETNIDYEYTLEDDTWEVIDVKEE